MHGKNPLYSKVVLVIRYLVLLGVVSSPESSCGQKGKGYSLTKKGIFDKSQKRREVKDIFENEVVEKIFPMGLPVSRVTSYSQHVL